MIDELKKILDEGQHSLVIWNGTVRTFDGRGISDLYKLRKDGAEFLKGVSVADKIVGKAAASLMMLGGIKELYADTISELALDLLKLSEINVTFGKKVPHVINRTKTGWCPMETACRDCRTAEECLVEIDKFMADKC